MSPRTEHEVYYIDHERLRVVKTKGLSINSVHPENPGPDKCLWFPEFGFTSSGFDVDEKKAKQNLFDWMVNHEAVLLKELKVIQRAIANLSVEEF